MNPVQTIIDRLHPRYKIELTEEIRQVETLYELFKQSFQLSEAMTPDNAEEVLDQLQVLSDELLDLATEFGFHVKEDPAL